MTHENNLTGKVTEREIIEREFPCPYQELGLWQNMTHERSIQQIIHRCARSARDCSIENSKSEQRSSRGFAVLKTLWTLGLTAGTAYMINNFRELGNFAQTATPILALFTAYQLKLNIWGKHVFTGARTYYKAPYFSIADELKIANGWKRIAQLQKEGKISVGIENVRTSDCYLELGRNQFGGP